MVWGGSTNQKGKQSYISATGLLPHSQFELRKLRGCQPQHGRHTQDAAQMRLQGADLSEQSDQRTSSNGNSFLM
jgi:hypothetical protein